MSYKSLMRSCQPRRAQITLENEETRLKENMMNKQTEIYQTEDGALQLPVTFDQDDLWLSQAQIAELFGTKRPAITKHLGNVFKSAELEEKMVSSIL